MLVLRVLVVLVELVLGELLSEASVAAPVPDGAPPLGMVPFPLIVPLPPLLVPLPPPPVPPRLLSVFATPPSAVHVAA